MTDKRLIQPTQLWTKRARRAIPYGPFARLGDWLAARRDARVALPSLLMAHHEDMPGGVVPWETPHTIFLGQLGRGRAEKEWLHYRKEIAGHLMSLAQARADRDAARRQLGQAQQHLAGLTPPGDDELTACRSGEQNTDVAVVRARRMRAYTERLHAAEASVQRFGAQVAECETAVARLSEPIRLRFEVAKTRAELIDAYVRRRRASYLTRLVRTQSEAARPGTIIRSDWPERPGWIARAISPDLAEPDAPGTPADAVPMGGS
jgi:hypothetical protein